MAGINVFDMFAKLSVDSSEFDAGMSKAQGVVKSVGGGIKTGLKVAGAAIGAATTAVVGFGAASVKTGMSFDKSMSQVAATMGMSMDEVHDTSTQAGKDFQTLRDFAMEMGRTTQFSAVQCSDALNYMALAGYDTETSLKMLPNVLSLAAAGAMDLATASDMITDTQTAFGMSTERTTLLVDEMAKAASSGNTSVSQLGEAFLTIGGFAKELNGGFVTTTNGAKLWADGTQELTIAPTNMANAGIKGSEAGTHMRNMIQKLSGPTSEGAKALEAMGVSAFDSEGKMRSLTDIFQDLSAELGNMTQEKKLNVIQDLFNSRDIAAAEALLGAVEGTVVKLGDEVLSLGSAYEKYGEDIYDASKGFEIVKSSWDDVGEKVLDAKLKLEDASQVVIDSGVAWEKYGITARGKIDEVAGDIRTNLITANMSVGETAALIADQYDIGLQDAIKVVQDMKTKIDETTGAAQTMADVQLDNLAGDATKFSSALEGAKILISNQLTPSLRKFVQFGTDGVSRIADAFNTGGLSGAMEEFGNVLSEGLTQVIEALPQAIEAGAKLLGAIGQSLVDNAPTLWTSVEEVASLLGGYLTSGMQMAADGLADFDWAGTVGNLADWLNEAISSEGVADFLQCAESIIISIMDGIAESAPVIAEKAPAIITNIVTGITDNIDGLIDGGIKMAEGLADGMMQGQDAIIEQVPKIFESLAGAILRNGPKLIASWISIRVQLMAHVPQLIAEITVAIAQGLVGIINQIIAFGQQLIPQVISIGSQVLSSVVSFLSQLPAKIAYWVGFAVGRFTTALAELPSKAKEKFNEVMSRAQEFFKSFQTEGPKSAKDMADKFIKAMNNLPANIKKIGKDVVEKLKEGIQSAWGAFVTWLLEKLASIGSAFAKGKSDGSKGKKSAGVSSYSAEGESTVSSLQRVLSEGSTDLAISHRIEDANEEKTIDYDRLASAMVKAFEQTDFTMEIDDREFGRVVRKAVAY